MTNLSRRQWMSHGLGLAGALAAPQWALAQAKYPAKPVRVIVPFAATFMPVEIFAGTMRGMGDSMRPTAIICLSVCVVRVLWIMTMVVCSGT